MSRLLTISKYYVHYASTDFTTNNLILSKPANTTILGLFCIDKNLDQFVFLTFVQTILSMQASTYYGTIKKMDTENYK